MEIDLVKLYLVDRHKIYVLQDMCGPTDIQAGRSFIAKSMPVNFDNNEKFLAAVIAAEINDHMEDATAALFAFYKFEDQQIRFGWLTI